MKKIILAILFSAFGFYGSFAQNFDMKTLEKYSNLGYDDYPTRAKSLADQYKPNENGELEASFVMEYPEMTKKELFKKVYDWIITIASNDKSAIQYSDQDEGVIKTRCYFGKIARRTMGDNRYWVSIRPLLTFEFKEGKMRFSYLLQNYEVLKRNDDSGYGVLAPGGVFFTGDGVTKDSQVWSLNDCYPYAKKSDHPKVTASKGFVHSIACMNLLKDTIDKTIKSPTQKKNDDW